MKKKAIMIAVPATLTIAVLLGCSAEVVEPAYEKSDQLPHYQQETFEQYATETRQWLAENRVFMTDNKRQELDANSPKEYQPTDPNGQAVLLVHGLGDSPYSFVDVATHLQQQGYLVRTILLPGHGSKVGDLMLPTLQDWQQVVDHHTKLLQKQYDSVWLGGYSTGANLVTSQAINDPSISGLMLFSPAFQPNSPAVQYAEFASNFVTWADQDPENNYLRYNSLPMNGAAVYYQTSEVVRDNLAKQPYNKPVFVMMSEGDSVIDTQFVAEQFSNTLTNPNNALIWQGESSLNDPRSTAYSMKIDEQRISNGSHMGLLFSPQNPNYGIDGSEIICSNGQGVELEEQCIAGEPVWYSAWGHQEAGKIHARLTYNPYFEESMNALDDVLSAVR
ncbi:alpha/beta fold hydrolase [Vibrio makurazakiensis]|uniref:alpha/beta hydrolase n=1 Tax=Vibrio makurazakiensis TaxID=2910250 RepID=UPI003D09E193